MERQPNQEFLDFMTSLGRIWTPSTNPPDRDNVPLDVEKMSETDLSHWLNVCTSWASFAQSQLGLAAAQKIIVQKRFSRIINDLIVSKSVKQRTYDLQVAEVLHDNPEMTRLHEELGHLEATIALWERQIRAYDYYVKLFFDERDKRRFSRNG